MNSLIHKNCRRLILSLALLATVILSVFSQNYNIKTFTTENGLSHNNVREMVFDSTGFLWIATWDGLNRYDGYGFTSYHHIPGDSTSLPYFSVRGVFIDGSDNLWILTDNGNVARFNRETNDFTRIGRINGEKAPVFPNIVCDENGDIWLLSNNVIFRYQHKTGTFIKYQVILPDLNSIIDHGSGFTMTFAGSNRFWLTGMTTYEIECNEARKMLIVKNIYRLRTRETSPEKMIRNYDHSSWFSMFIDKTGKKWMFSSYGLFQINESSGEIDEFTGKIQLNALEGKKVFYWGSQSGGLNIYFPGSSSIIMIPENSVQLLKNITCRDKDMIWFSNTSFTGNPLGLSRIIFTPEYFKKYKVDTESDKLPAVYSITVDNQKRVWCGIRGRDHIVVITPDNEIIRKYTPASGLPGYYGPVRSLKRTESGIWVGYFYRMLLFYDYKTESFKEFYPGPYMYRALEVLNDGKLYIGTSELIMFDPSTNRKELLVDSIPGSINFRFSKGKDQTLWAALPTGTFFRYSPIENKFRLFRLNNASNNVEDVCEGDSGDVWLAVLGAGLVRYNTENGASRVYTTSDGLSNNTVYSILRDRKGNIWASTDEGISRINPATGIIKRFGPSEGLDIVEFNSGASFADEDGRFYFGGMGGAVSFNPDSIDSIKFRDREEQIILSGLTVSGKIKILDHPVYKSDFILLDRGEDNFHITIVTSDFASSEKTDYRYKLSRHDNDWILTDHQNRNINYNNLNPGTYTLEIEATDRNGEWSLHKNLAIKISSYVYQTSLFKTAVAILLVFLVSGMIMIYIRQLSHKERQIQDELRLQALRGQMNPHFIFNSLNSINYFISNNDKLSANRYIGDFSRLIRTILSNMGSDFVPFVVEMDSVKDYLEIEHLRFGDKFDYGIDLRGADEIEYLHVFPGLIQPFLENAIWHGVRALNTRKGFIKIKVYMPAKDKITCVIEDDGIGRKASQEMRKSTDNHNSRGIGIVLERLQIISKLRGINYNLDISDLYPGGNEPGTRVKIDLPVKYVH
jgi:ligand-binding sensor domain-containing protein